VILAALAAASLAAASPAPPAGGTGAVLVEAGTVVYDGTTRRYRIEDGVVLRRGAVVLRAATAELDPATGEVTAAGGVLLTDATRVVAAEVLRAVLGGSFEAEEVVAFLKAGPVDLSGAAELEAARAAGSNRLSLSARSIRGGTDARLKVSGARLTLCDCGPGVVPTWSFHASEADVIPGDRAILSWPVLHVRAPFTNRSVPVFALPWLYVPLGDRQTGLLLPELEQTSATGFMPVLPLFVTLGRSADLTLTPGWAFGRSRSAGDAEAAVRGPLSRLELRWAPAPDAEGRAELLWVHDADDEPLGAAGHRFGLSLRHRQGSEDGLALAADLSLTTDGVLHRDLTADAFERKARYRRSSLLAAHRAGPALLELGSAYLQPLQPGGASGPYGLAGVNLPLAHPLAWVSATLPATPLGPLLASARAGLARFAPVRGWEDLSGRPEVTRLDARLQLAAPFILASAVALSPFVRGAALAYPGAEGADGQGRPAAAWAVAGASASSEVSRAYGAVRHAIGARAEWRLGTPTAGSPPASAAYDLFDRTAAEGTAGALLDAAPPGRFHQLRLSLVTRLTRGGSSLARLEAGQDLDLAAGRASDAFVRGALALGLVRAELLTRFPGPGAERRPAGGDGFLDAFSELAASLSVGELHGTEVHATLLSMGTWASGSQLAGLDVLFDPRAVELGPSSRASVGAHLALGPALLGYDVWFPGRASVIDGRSYGALEALQQAASLSWDSPCRCLRASVRVQLDASGRVSGLKGEIQIARPGENAGLH
jgi:LPS-assembly protein